MMKTKRSMSFSLTKETIEILNKYSNRTENNSFSRSQIVEEALIRYLDVRAEKDVKQYLFDILENLEEIKGAVFTLHDFFNIEKPVLEEPSKRKALSKEEIKRILNEQKKSR